MRGNSRNKRFGNRNNESPFGYTLDWNGPRRILTSTNYLSIAILPTIGSVNSKALRGALPRTENDKWYAIPFDFLSMLVGLIDGDGYISITQTPGGFIRIQLIFSMNMWELDMVKYIQSVLKFAL